MNKNPMNKTKQILYSFWILIVDIYVLLNRKQVLIYVCSFVFCLVFIYL